MYCQRACLLDFLMLLEMHDTVIIYVDPANLDLTEAMEEVHEMMLVLSKAGDAFAEERYERLCWVDVFPRDLPSSYDDVPILQFGHKGC